MRQLGVFGLILVFMCTSLPVYADGSGGKTPKIKCSAKTVKELYNGKHFKLVGRANAWMKNHGKKTLAEMCEELEAAIEEENTEACADCQTNEEIPETAPDEVDDVRETRDTVAYKEQSNDGGGLFSGGMGAFLGGALLGVGGGLLLGNLLGNRNNNNNHHPGGWWGQPPGQFGPRRPPPLLPLWPGGPPGIGGPGGMGQGGPGQWGGPAVIGGAPGFGTFPQYPGGPNWINPDPLASYGGYYGGNMGFGGGAGIVGPGYYGLGIGGTAGSIYNGGSMYPPAIIFPSTNYQGNPATR